MKVILILLALGCGLISQAQTPGPYYFVSDAVNGKQFYWRERQGFAGVIVLQNYNLLATVLGDTPVAPSGSTLVAEEVYNYTSSASVRLQPFVIRENGKKTGLPPGPRLIRFLNDPLNGGQFNLSLPFKDNNVALSDNSGLIRREDTDATWHIAIDFDYSGNTTREFDVTAAADGQVIGQEGSAVVIEHQANNGRRFLTIYQHLNPTSVVVNRRALVKRGDLLGKLKAERTSSGGLYAHLHFAVAVKGPAAKINGQNIPELWYLIDPFGVQDYRRNLNSSMAYNYLPNNRMDRPVRGRKHVYVFTHDPPLLALLKEEDCISFNPDQLTISPNGTTTLLKNGNSSLFLFPNAGEATAARDKIRHYRMNKSCFVGRPNPDFNYLLVGNSSPSGAHTPENCISFNPSQLKVVRNSNRTYNLNSGRIALYTFPNQQEAEQSKQIIQKYGFQKSCFIGRPDPSFHYLRK